MARFQLIRSVLDDVANSQAALEVVQNDNAFARLEQGAKRILLGEADIPLSGNERLILNGEIQDEFDKAEYIANNFNLPIKNYVAIQGGSYKQIGKNLNVEEVEYDGIFLDSAIIDISMRKNIITTKTNGKRGTRKEYIADGDYDISISGVIASRWTGKYPEDEVKALKEVLESPELLVVTSPQLNRLDINQMVILSYDFSQKSGFYNTQEFKIRALSHQATEVFIEGIELNARKREELIQNLENSDQKKERTQQIVDEAEKFAKENGLFFDATRTLNSIQNDQIIPST